MIGKGSHANQTDRIAGGFTGDAPTNPYELAAFWADRTRWPLLPDQRTVVTELQELDVMSTLADWLTRWIPIQVHAALIRGASVPAVAAAAGVAPAKLRELWEPWADRQVDLWTTSNPARRLGLNPAERDVVRAVLDAFDSAHDQTRDSQTDTETENGGEPR